MGSVNITIANGGLGATLQTNDGIVGLVLTGATESGGYTLGTPRLVTSLKDLSTGTEKITLANNAFAYRQVSDFYTNAKDGAQLFIMLVASTQTVSDMVDHANANGAKKLLDYAAGKIKVLFVMSDDTVVTVASITAGINPACYTALTKGAVLASDYLALEKPMRIVIGATSYNGNDGSLTDETSGTSNNRCALLLGDIEASTGYSGGKAACLGYLAGLVAVLPVQRKISRVHNGPLLGVDAAYAGTETIEAAGGDMAVIAGKGFITFTTYVDVAGYFIAGDPMCTATTDDYKSLSNGRVIDKAHRITYQTYVQEIDDEILINEDGTMDANYVAHLQEEIINAIDLTMGGTKEVSFVDCYINPAQNVLSTGKVAIKLRVTPVGYSDVLEIDLGFANPALAA